MKIRGGIIPLFIGFALIALTIRSNKIAWSATQQTMRQISELAPLLTSSLSSVRKLNIVDFEHQEGVVIAVKIHAGSQPQHIDEIKQSLCLLHAAYNQRVLYDIVIFSTFPIPEHEVQALQQIVAPASLTVQPDEQTLEEQLADLTARQQKILIDRCTNVTSISDFTWETICTDGPHIMPISYCWMSEFRSKQVWQQTILEKYKYMLWFDSDSFPTRVWAEDPVAFMVRNDLVLLMANLGQGKTPGKLGVQHRINMVYNKTLCSIRLTDDGRLNATYGSPQNSCHDNEVQHVHGFFHITNLDFYRSPQNQYWSKVMIGSGKFSRVWDDQLAVIVPAAMLAPHRAMDMESVGIFPEVMHNGVIMGKRNFVGGAYKKFWKRDSPTQFPEAIEKCDAYITIPSR